VPKAPSDYSPTSNPAKAKERRDLVLDLMAKNGFVTQAEAEAAKAKPIQLADTAYYQSQHKSSPFDYPVEYIRQELEDKYTTRVAKAVLRSTRRSTSKHRNARSKCCVPVSGHTTARTPAGVPATR